MEIAIAYDIPDCDGNVVQKTIVVTNEDMDGDSNMFEVMRLFMNILDGIGYDSYLIGRMTAYFDEVRKEGNNESV